MILRKIYVKNFRNIKEAELEFSSTANVFFGDNAQGKTNLLEAISLALGKSFRNIKSSPFAPFDANDKDVVVKLYYESEYIPDRLNEIVYESDGFKNEVKINSFPLKKAADLYGEFKYVIFIPDSLNLIKGYPDVRRYYLDNIAVIQNKAHKKIQYEYKEALKQRCAACSSNYFFGGALEAFDDVLIKQGINLTYGRLKYLELIKNYALDLFKEFSGEELGIEYKSDIFNDKGAFEEDRLKNKIDFSDKDKLYEIYKSKLNLNSGENFINKIPGVHRDDVVFSINGKNARNFASQGQLRSVAVVLKLAEADLIKNFNREKPVVLLDEVLGELDKKRRDFIIKRFANSQVFITSCNINDFENIPGIKIWNVNNGEFTIDS